MSGIVVGIEGSLCNQVVHHAHCPVVVVQGATMEPDTR
jgi:nucleotide-binding universal stress UspA family protein